MKYLRSRLLVLEGLQGNCLDRHDNGFVDNSGEEGLTGKQRSKATKSSGRKETTPTIDPRNTEEERGIYIQKEKRREREREKKRRKRRTKEERPESRWRRWEGGATMRVIIIFCHGPYTAMSISSYASLYHAIPGVEVQYPVRELAPAA